MKTVLLYVSETWRTTKRILSRVQSFLNNCLRRILGICWKDKVTNEQLWEWAEEELIFLQVKRRKWGWIGHTLRRPTSNTRHALSWNSQAKRKRRRPRNSWRRDLECEVKDSGLSWTELRRRPRTACGGGNSSMAYAPQGSKSLSE